MLLCSALLLCLLLCCLLWLWRRSARTLAQIGAPLVEGVVVDDACVEREGSTFEGVVAQVGMLTTWSSLLASGSTSNITDICLFSNFVYLHVSMCSIIYIYIYIYIYRYIMSPGRSCPALLDCPGCKHRTHPTAQSSRHQKHLPIQIVMCQSCSLNTKQDVC